MKKIQEAASFIFIIAIAILSVISILGVWKIFQSDTIVKSFETIGLLAVVAVIVMIAGHYMEGKSQVEGQTIVLPNPVFKTVRQSTLTILIAAVSILAFLGVLAIWDVFTDKSVLYKTVGSLAILAFSSFLIVITSLYQEDNDILKNKNISIGGVVTIIIAGFLLVYFFGIFR